MPEFDADDVRRYYDRHTDNFVTYGQGGAAGAIHRAVWGPGADSPSAAFRYVEHRILEQLDTLSAGPAPTHVVDLGCGVGASLCYLAARLPIRGTGITLSPVQVQHAERRIREAGLSDRLACLEGDYCALPESIPPADLAYAVESFVHGPNPARFFAQCARLIRPDGLLVICDDFRRPATEAAATRAVERFRRGWHLNSLIHPEDLRAVATAAGFEHVSTHDLTPHLDLGRPRDRLVATFIALFGWLPLDGTRFGHLVGGSALHTCLARGWIGYDLALFRRRSDGDGGDDEANDELRRSPSAGAGRSSRGRGGEAPG